MCVGMCYIIPVRSDDCNITQEIKVKTASRVTQGSHFPNTYNLTEEKIKINLK